LKLVNVGVGDILIADADCPHCTTRGNNYVVRSYQSNDAILQSLHGGKLYIRCSGGEHFLEGQVDDDELAGFTRRPKLRVVS
jgi:hypothetical protein